VSEYKYFKSEDRVNVVNEKGEYEGGFEIEDNLNENEFWLK
jgi:hypothetical protein